MWKVEKYIAWILVRILFFAYDYEKIAQNTVAYIQFKCFLFELYFITFC